MTLVTKDNKRIRAHKVVLASVSSIFSYLFQTYFEDNEYQLIYMRGVATKHVLAMVNLVYNAINWRRLVIWLTIEKCSSKL